MKKDEKFKTFDELIEAALLYESIEKPVSEWHKFSIISYYHFQFNVWLQENKGWEFGNEVQYTKNLTKKNWLQFLKHEHKTIKDLKREFEAEKLSWQITDKMPIDLKIFHFKERCLPFRHLNNTVETVCQWVKPIYPSIKPQKYIEFFFENIDFEKIDNEPTKEEETEFCKAIYYGLEEVLKHDVDNAIREYQNNISRLSSEEIKETQKYLIGLIGNLKLQARGSVTGISFTNRYLSFLKNIEARRRLISIDYQVLITEFNETIINNLLSSFQTISEQLKEIAPLMGMAIPQRSQPNIDQLKVNQIALIHVYEGIQITRVNAAEIAAKYGYIKPNSGEGLFQDYIKYCSGTNRKGKPTLCTPKKLENKIKLFESITVHLTDKAKQWATDEIKILKTIFETEYQ